ncbi:hypothetical protein AXFE_23750 [Acidithrix ferrooxidans]|uniref:Uncharacterized protein n=1 Tax=Acidithrix ferrooxidans TaxID=1280514 RepID=A0A0D8HI87_9ACTN|nr:hypothetical protein AXFE_23750 [Acidithrix ferrooxidans]
MGASSTSLFHWHDWRKKTLYEFSIATYLMVNTFPKLIYAYDFYASIDLGSFELN